MKRIKKNKISPDDKDRKPRRKKGKQQIKQLLKSYELDDDQLFEDELLKKNSSLEEK